MAEPIPYRCPVCRATRYHCATPERQTGRVYECEGCSILFRDPVRWTRFEPFSAGVLHPAPDFKRNWGGKDSAGS